MTHIRAAITPALMLVGAVALAPAARSQFGGAAQASTMAVRYDTMTTAEKAAIVSSVTVMLPLTKEAAAERVIGALTAAGWQLESATPLLITTGPGGPGDVRLTVTLVGVGDSTRVTVRGRATVGLYGPFAVTSEPHGWMTKMWPTVTGAAAAIATPPPT